MKKYKALDGRHWVTQEFISDMQEKLGSIVQRLPEGSFHVYSDMTGSNEIFFIKHLPIKEVFGDENLWEAVYHPGFKESFDEFIQVVLRKEKMPRKRLVSEVDFSIWGLDNKKMAARAPGGQYGFTKKVEKLCLGANRRLQRKAATLVKKAVRKDAKVLEFLQTHSKRARSIPAKTLIAAYRDSIPKLASKTACEGNVCTCGGSCGCEEVSSEEFDLMTRQAGLQMKKAMMSQDLLRQELRNAFSRSGGRLSKPQLKKIVDGLYKKYKLSNPRQIQLLVARLKREKVLDEAGGYVMWVRGRMASKRKYGMYGFLEKTASLGLQTCSQLRQEAGHIGSDLHMRKADLYEPITSFLSQHGKTARCNSSKLLLSVYPESHMFKNASKKDFSVQEWLAYEPEP
jgi:hypothetical protein